MIIDDYQVIDSDNYAEAGIETMVFPGGEPHVKFNKPLHNKVLLFMKLRTWIDNGYAFLIIDTLRQAMCDHRLDDVIAFIPYFPGARQDRREPLLGPFTARTMLHLLQIFYIHTITFDAHSPFVGNEVALNMMPSDIEWDPSYGEPPTNVVGIIAPDAGAVVRAADFRDKLYPTAQLVQCSKRRDPVTGKLSGYTMPALTVKGRYIIVDDICDGGGTFNLLADEWRKDPLAADCHLELFVSHGIFSKGLVAIDPVIERITTTNSWCDTESNERLTVIPLEPLFSKIIKRIGT